MDELLAPVVARIVDHHVDEGMYAAAQRDIQLVGSCATLVVCSCARLTYADAAAQLLACVRDV
jgi:hypothetical protein